MRGTPPLFQHRQNLGNHRFVTLNQSAFLAPLSGVTEYIQRRTSQHPQFGEHAENRNNPWSKLGFLRKPSVWIATGQEWWCKVEHQLVVTLKLLGNTIKKTAFDMKTGNLVLVFDRQ
ncbi:hypothetical protein D3C86_1906410 [compost metagenome]